MLNFVKVLSAEIANAKRIIKFLRFGLSDVQTSSESMPAGVDSSPIEKMTAVYGKTSAKGGTVILGYINTKQLAQPGETRIFSIDSNGDLKTFVWLKANGDLILGGDSDFAVRFGPMADTIKELQEDVSALKDAFNTWAPTPNDGGAALKAAAAAWTATPLQEDIDDSKIATIKTP